MSGLTLRMALTALGCFGAGCSQPTPAAPKPLAEPEPREGVQSIPPDCDDRVAARPRVTAADVARALRALEKDAYQGWAPGTRWTFSSLGPNQPGYSTQPDQEYEIVAGELLRRQRVDGRNTVQRLPLTSARPIPAATGLEEARRLGYTRETRFEIDDSWVPAVYIEQPGIRYWVDNEHRQAPPRYEWVLALDPEVLLKSEDQYGTWELRSVSKQVSAAGRVIACVEVRKRSPHPGGASEVDTCYSPEIPGHVVELVKRFYKYDAAGELQLWFVRHEKLSAVDARR